ncbi:hypothetical protein [Bradyrhizobium sp. CCGUVB23]|uniref:hypothetical protein n=1 Tax=Bradyrhizobium sp. CCGUVB23 TaxID=2949630 RepID=UPI0020B256C9|nr:hypothetical protein [Bradyrhizobium sp. CCGUVB23]MCP3464907.1 hypothetical protein [Bradyrhizobium sp. CCGUVB23]
MARDAGVHNFLASRPLARLQNTSYELRVVYFDQWTACPSWKGIIMKLSSSAVAPSILAMFATVFLCGPASSQGSATSTLPGVTVNAPEQAARPHHLQRGSSNTGTSRRTTGTSTAQTPVFAPNSTLGRLAKLEREARSCNGGCETSFRVGNAPWVGCSLAAGGYDSSNFSPTCTDTLSYNTYAQCVETKAFLGAQPRESRWICTSLLAGGKLPGEKQFAEHSGRR